MTKKPENSNCFDYEYKDIEITLVSMVTVLNRTVKGIVNEGVQFEVKYIYKNNEVISLTHTSQVTTQ